MLQVRKLDEEKGAGTPVQGEDADDDVPDCPLGFTVSISPGEEIERDMGGVNLFILTVTAPPLKVCWELSDYPSHPLSPNTQP